ncbi:MAG: precorrin-3B C(17)-methyltransferase [Candidatus Nezhaarchaeota archaeon]|nr:precorrin-3B C(17)-methyltransferase [Candidatus Nezhaarchaeota archaeon]
MGIGPGSVEDMTLRARQEIERADVVIGYRTYVELIKRVIKKETEIIIGKMGEEVKRAKIAIQKALEGKHVVVVSSGDAGVYGMAGLVIEVAEAMNVKVPIEVVPGVMAATAAAAKLGAPLMDGFVVISLSDLLTPWKEIEKRLIAAAQADMVIVLYNPKSRTRMNPLVKAHEILLKYRSSDTPVGIVRNVGREEEEVVITNLREMLKHHIDMTTTIIIGSSKTRMVDGKMVTSRGYHILRTR